MVTRESLGTTLPLGVLLLHGLFVFPVCFLFGFGLGAGDTGASVDASAGGDVGGLLGVDVGGGRGVVGGGRGGGGGDFVRHDVSLFGCL